MLLLIVHFQFAFFNLLHVNWLNSFHSVRIRDHRWLESKTLLFDFVLSCTVSQHKSLAQQENVSDQTTIETRFTFEKKFLSPDSTDSTTWNFRCTVHSFVQILFYLLLLSDWLLSSVVSSRANYFVLRSVILSIEQIISPIPLKTINHYPSKTFELIEENRCQTYQWREDSWELLVVAKYLFLRDKEAQKAFQEHQRRTFLLDKSLFVSRTRKDTFAIANADIDLFQKRIYNQQRQSIFVLLFHKAMMFHWRSHWEENINCERVTINGISLQ